MRPNTGEIHSNVTTAMSENAIVFRDHLTLDPSVRKNTATAVTPPRNPVRSPVAPGSIERVAATAPAIMRATSITPLLTVASEFGNQFMPIVAGSEATVPRIATYQI
jgi:hypothetical protein